MKILKEELEQVDDLSVVLQYKDVQNISIKIDKDGRILVGLPYYGAKARALTFVREKADWLRKHLASRAEQELPIPDNGFDGTNIWLWGKHYTAIFAKATGEEQVLLRDKELLFTYKGALTERKKQQLVERFYWRCLQEMLEKSLERWQGILGLYANSWKMQRLKSKWGRCNVATKELLFNVSLVHRPLSCLEYVVLHELAHLYEASHNQRFKSFLSRYMPDWKVQRDLVNKFIFRVEN